MATFINLKERFGRRYRVTYGESYYAEHGEKARVEDPVHMIIPCKYGHIYAAGEETLAAGVDGHPNVAGQLRRLKCCQVHQDGDLGELTVLFDVTDFAKVVKIMRPRRRRQLSEAERQRLRVIGFQKGRQVHSNRHSTARTCIFRAQEDSDPIPRQPGLF